MGSGVTSLAEGDRVAIEPVYRCDECVPCRQGRYNVCAKVGFHGLSIDGGMAEFTVVDERMAHKLPDDVSMELGALVEPMSVAYHAAMHGQLASDDMALVFGAGPIGIGLWYALRGQGVEDVLVVEPSAVRRASIEKLGARTLDPTAVDVPEFVADHTGGRGAGAAFDAAGVQPAVEAALASIGPSRAMVTVAIYEKPLKTPLLQLVMREARIQGTLCYTGDDYRAVIDLMSRGHYDTTGWVETFALGKRRHRGIRSAACRAEDEGAARPESLRPSVTLGEPDRADAREAGRVAVWLAATHDLGTVSTTGPRIASAHDLLGRT